MEGGDCVKKKVIAMMAIVVCLIVTTSVSAKSLRDIYLRAGDDVQVIVKNDTEAKFHTSVLATYMNASQISVENTVQRKNIFGSWQNKQQVYPLVKVLNQGYDTNFDLKSTADTRSIWVNVTSGTTLIGNVYINNGHK